LGLPVKQGVVVLPKPGAIAHRSASAALKNPMIS
jgi:hypothetical protein